MLAKLLHWKEGLMQEPDEHGWTPLHLAARFWNLVAARTLIEWNKSVVYIKDDEGRTALHISAAIGDVRMMELLLLKCPDCWEMVNKKGENIFHIAADMERDGVIRYIGKKTWRTRLINQKDNEGRTPLHVLASKGTDQSGLLLNYRGAALLTFDSKSFSPREILGREANSKWWSPGEMLLEKSRDTVKKDQDCIIKWKSRKERKQEAAEEISKMAKTHIVVATLISAISFAAGFTIPGGYEGVQDPNPGMAIKVRDATFKAFIITNTTAVLCSMSSIFLYVSAAVFNSKYDGDRRTQRYMMAFWLIIISMVAMIFAFITGTFTMLPHSLGLGIATGVIGCSAFIVFVFELSRHIAKEITSARYLASTTALQVKDIALTTVNFAGKPIIVTVVLACAGYYFGSYLLVNNVFRHMKGV